MKNLVVIFSITAALSAGLVFAAASGVFGEPTAVASKVNPLRGPAGDDPRSTDEIRKEALKKLHEAQDNGIVPRDPSVPTQGPDIQPPVFATSPEEAAAAAVTPTFAPTAPGAISAPPQNNNGQPLPTSGPSPERIKEIVDERIENDPYKAPGGPTITPIGRGATVKIAAPR